MKHPLRTALALAIALAPFAVHAQAYPSKPVHIVVPYAAGGATDNYARLYGRYLSDIWGQQVIVDNRPGAGGNIGAAAAAKSPTDGYTILLNTSGQTIAPSLYRKLAYDPARDLQPVVMLTRGNYVLAVHPSVRAARVRELVALAKGQPGKLNFGSTGMGSGPHLAGELLRSLAGIDTVHVPYKGDAAMTPAMLANEVQFAFLPSQAAMPHVKSGKLRPLGVASAKRSVFLPDVPTIMEDVPGYELSTWAGLFVPAGTPRPVVQRISTDTVRVIQLPEVQKVFAGWGIEGAAVGVDEFEKIYQADIVKYARIVREAKIPLVD